MDSLLFECWLKSYSILKVNFDSKFKKKLLKYGYWKIMKAKLQ